MNTIILDKPGEFRFAKTQAPTSPVRDGEALVRVRRVGICGTDIHAFGGNQPFFTYPRILGHELGVEILEIGSNSFGLQAGDRCAVEPYLNCGSCVACRMGKTNCCANLKVLGVHIDGGMRERIVVPVHKLHKSEKLSLEQLATIEMLSIGCHAVDRANVQKDENVLIIGAGPIGLGVTLFARIAGANPIVMDLSEKRLAFCRKEFPDVRTIDARQSPLDQLKTLTGNDLATAVFDATGSPKSMMGCFQYASAGGRIVFVSVVQADITFHDPELHRKELSILATRNSTGSDFRKIIDLMENGMIDTTRWITHHAACDAMIDQFPAWIESESGCVKAIVEFSRIATILHCAYLALP